MQCESCKEQIEPSSAVRVRNRVLHRVNRVLRAHAIFSKTYADNLFVELCQPGPAELAMRRLCDEMGFPEVGPEDYESVVDALVVASRAYRVAEEPVAAS